MNNKAVTLSLAMAVIAVLFVESYVSSIEQEAEKKFGTKVMVVVAKDDIGESQTINETLMELRPIPKRFLEPAAISFEVSEEDGSAARDMNELSGMVAIIPIRKGEQITYNKIIEPSLRTGLSPQVTPGRRAVAVSINEFTGVAKLVKPGDRVDVIAVLDIGRGSRDKVAKTILQDIPILAVGRRVTNNIPRVIERRPGSKKPQVKSLTRFDGFTSVTLELDPEQVQTLSLITANRNNMIMLSLRNNDDTDRSSLGSTSLKDLMGTEAVRTKTRRRK